MLELVDLHRRFGDRLALDGLDVTVPAGTVLGFLGPNGAGKTTAMRGVMGILALDSGEVRWEGRPVDRRQRLRFGYMPEERGLYPRMRLGEHLELLARLHGLNPRASARAAAGWLERLGLGERAGDRVESLSQGNQQRVQLAAALVHDPDVVLLDEPFAGLDPVGIDALAAVLRELAGHGVTVVFSSHQLDLVEEVCERVAIVHRGRLLVEGRVDSLTAPDGRHLSVEVAGPGEAAGGPHRWVDGVAGADVVGRDGDRLRVALHDGARPADVLAAAAAAGEVRHFSLDRRRLSEVFRRAVAG